MTEKEFEKYINSLTDNTDREYALEDWDCMTDAEKAGCSVEDMERHIYSTYEAVKEARYRDVPKDKIMVAVLDDSYYDENGSYPEEFDSDLVYEGFVFNTPEEFIQKWYELDEGAWYWVFDKEEVICSGAVDPADIEIFEDYFDMVFEGPEEEFENDVDKLIGDAKSRIGDNPVSRGCDEIEKY